ncbi:uncharacterized protein LOC116212973 isoform X2 [Punica granatum]|uniref:Uncharacterized protein LOC116212973 isoform X2 n=1 Tax=Punica granatum TaxID=22663 RepID=A0A6P8EAR4_PUNGR|nr:uncharacterized protein LOC116212973 isoform X2 [Punica granatum]
MAMPWSASTTSTFYRGLFLRMPPVSSRYISNSHLLRKGANLRVKDQDAATPLHYAFQVSARQTVKLLTKCKVDINVQDNEGWTPLHIAMQTTNRDIGKILLVNGADKTRNDLISGQHGRSEGRNARGIITAGHRGGGHKRLYRKINLRRNGKDIYGRIDGKTPPDLCLSYGKDFKSYDLAKMLKLTLANNRYY